MFNRSRNDESSQLRAIPEKANFVLKVILCVLIIIGFRIWHLGVIQHEKKVQEAFQPRRKVVLEPPVRGTIRDRFNVILAANRQEFRLSIIYSQFRDIPSWITHTAPDGTKQRRYLRKEYIHKLSEMIASVVGLDAARLEDVIYSHGALNNAIPLVIKKDLTEQHYFRLKALEKDWVGIQVQAVPKRYYPKGKVACDVVGYLGPISKEKYSRLIAEIATLSDYVNQYEQGIELPLELPPGVGSFIEAKGRLLELQEKAYSINDNVGLLGIEASCDEELRGYSGKRIFFSDARGNALRELPGTSSPTSGKRVLLSISSELQEYAEELLTISEGQRAKWADSKRKEPVMRGGAIVALDPHTGEVLALASYPRHDPNDFIRAKGAFFDEKAPLEVSRWLESDSFISDVWNGKTALKRELYSDRFYEEETLLSWEKFLTLLLPTDSPLLVKLQSKTPIAELIALQRDFFALKDAYPGMTLEKLVELDALSMWFTGLNTLQEKLVYVDLSRLVISHEMVTDTLVKTIGSFSIDKFRKISAFYQATINEVQKKTKEVWREHYFVLWRKENEKQFLREKRLEERHLKKYARPYLDYIDQEEERQFKEFWNKNYKQIMTEVAVVEELPKELVATFLQAIRGYSDYTYPLIHSYGGIYTRHQEPIGQDLILSAIKVYGPGFCRSFAYRHPGPHGSLFKLITAYAGLKQRYIEQGNTLRQSDIGLFTITDAIFKQNEGTCVGYFPSGKPIPQLYKGGRIPKSLSKNIGTLDLLRAIETSSNTYFSLLAAEFLKNPLQLSQAAEDFGYGAVTGIKLPGEGRGKVPADLETNKTGLYSFAIGQHTLLTTPLQSAGMLSSLVNDGELLEPQIINLVVGKDPPFEEKELKKKAHFAFQDALGLVGIDFPLFIKTVDVHAKNSVEVSQRKQIRKFFMPKEIKNTLLEGLRRVIGHLRPLPPLSDQIVGKTSTAESQERIGLSCGYPSIIHNHTWFGGISFEKPLKKPFCFESPELVVVVYLRYGSYGKEAAPIAAKMIQKWRDIQTRSKD